jgi:hypothetical protein
LREHRPDTPAGVAQALIRGMSPIPEQRQRSASALLDDLAAGFAETRTSEVTSTGVPSPVPAQRQVGSRGVGHRRTRTLAVATVTLAVIALAAVWAIGRGEPSPPSSSPPVARATPARTPLPTSTPTASATASPSAAAPAATPTRSPAAALSATQTVRAFYRRAAAGDYARAWSLAGPQMRRAFGNSLQRFSRELSSLQRIGFQRVAIVARDKAGVTVDIRSVATHVNRVDRCTGTLRAIRRPKGGWLVEPAGVRCISS